jgi:hypothetical protein
VFALIFCSLAIAAGSTIGLVTIVQLKAMNAELRAVELRIEAAEQRQVEMAEALRAILEELNARGEWMTGQNKRWEELEARTEDRFRLGQFNDWARKQGLPEVVPHD